MLLCLACGAFLFDGGLVYAAGDDGVYITDDSFNTENVISLYGDGAEEAAAAIVAEFEIIDGLFSLTKDSQMALLNSQGYIYGADDRVVYLMGRALDLYNETDGAFNPASYLLTDLWQLSSRFGDGQPAETKPYDRPLYTLPEQKYIDAFKTLTDFGGVEISGNDIFLPDDSVTVDGVVYRMQIDLGGIVKGYAASRAREIAASYGVTSGYISLGGSSIVFLDGRDGEDFTVGVINPDNISTYYARVKVSGTAMSTSGDYQPGKYFELDGKRYCHIIDCETGEPVSGGIRTVSIICDDPILADAMTTALMVMGYDNARAYINGEFFLTNGIKAAVVYQKNWLFGNVKEVVTNTSADFWEITNPDYTLCGYTEEGVFVYNALNPNLWLFVAVAGVAAAVLVAVAVVKLRDRPRPDYKKQKFFRPWDIAVYGAALLCVAALFMSFVVFKQDVSLKYIRLYHGADLIYVYDMAAGEGAVADENYAGKIDVAVRDGVTYVTVTTGDKHNVVAIDGEGAKMVDADCSGTKECVNNFPKITTGDSVIICDVTHVKVVGSGDGEMPVISG